MDDPLTKIEKDSKSEWMALPSDDLKLARYIDVSQRLYTVEFGLSQLAIKIQEKETELLIGANNAANNAAAIENAATAAVVANRPQNRSGAAVCLVVCMVVVLVLLVVLAKFT